jgi:hypothetical protein
MPWMNRGTRAPSQLSTRSRRRLQPLADQELVPALDVLPAITPTEDSHRSPLKSVPAPGTEVLSQYFDAARVHGGRGSDPSKRWSVPAIAGGGRWPNYVELRDAEVARLVLTASRGNPWDCW